MQYVHKTMASPVGTLKLVANDVGLAAVLWEDDDPRRVRLRSDVRNDAHPLLVRAERELGEYFAGDRRAFSVPVDPVGTAFQRAVWRALSSIPFGQTRTYGQLARQVGSAGAGRAVGAANGRNPISIIAPCHRVIGATGKLTGFAGGLANKAFLLALEAGGTLTASSGCGERLRSWPPACG